MQELISEKQIKKLGYKKIRPRIYFSKPNKFMILCARCGSFFENHGGIKRNKLFSHCFWCSTDLEMPIEKNKLK